jgi:hypothetical protein
MNRLQIVDCKNHLRVQDSVPKNIPMMRQLLYPFLCVCFFLGGNAVFAADELGAEIQYRCIDAATGRYMISVTRYYACPSPSVQAPVIDIDGTCSAPVGLGNWQTVSVVDATPICPGIATICNGLSSPILDGVEAHVYEREYDFSAATAGCDDYMISFFGCCRPADLTSGAGGEGLYVEAGPLDPFLCNSAPEFLYQPVIILDTATEAHVALGANDPDGDSLAYDLVSCYDTAGTPNSYGSSYSALQPLGPDWNVQLDSRTGNIDFIPSPGRSVRAALCLEVREYRDGQLISSYVRDITVEALNNIPAQPSANLPSLLMPNVDSVWGGSWVSSHIVNASIGEPVIFELDVFDQENDTTVVSWSNNIPGLEFWNENDPTQTNTVIGRNPTVKVKYIPHDKGSKFFGVRLNDTMWCGITNIGDYSIGLDVRDTSFFARFPADTLFICIGDTLTLSPTIIGRQPTTPMTYTWGSGTFDSSLEVTLPGTYHVDVKDTLGGALFTRESSASVVVAYAPFCVWPGDADNDGVANNFDVLSIGLAYGHTGPVRSNQGTDWTGKQAAAWADTLPNGLNSVYANSNGDGIVDANDTLGILQNYGLSHLKGNGSNSGLPLFMVTPTSVANVGDTVSIFVFLGTNSIPADSVYGLAFSISYNNTLIDSGSAHFVVDSTWLGDPQMDLFSMQKDLFLEGQIDIGISRNDHMMRAGQGRIARLDIIMVDDIIDKREIKDTLKLNIVNVRLIAADGREIPVDASDELEIPVNDIIGSIPRLPDNAIEIYPNPTKNLINLEVHTTEGVSIYVYSIQGEEILSMNHVKGKKQIDLSSLSAGMYILQAKNSEGQIHKKIILSK